MLLRRDVLAPGRVDHHELPSDASRLVEEPLALAGQQVPIEVAREHSRELRVGEGQGDRVALNHADVRHALGRHRDHRLALVERHQLARQMSGEEAGAAGHVEGACGWQRAYHRDKLVDLL